MSELSFYEKQCRYDKLNAGLLSVIVIVANGYESRLEVICGEVEIHLKSITVLGLRVVYWYSVFHSNDTSIFQP